MAVQGENAKGVKACVKDEVASRPSCLSSVDAKALKSSLDNKA